ncbi:hypothetical protein R3P38DRAFT_2797669 [Favolaschia claudopus]|uniref:Uncharacterized protein n=1 Tax=Favolaschia claudopus TaxID=2862362 RepID=A0AAW0A2P5_9AGAR
MTRHYYSYCTAPAGQLLEVEKQKKNKNCIITSNPTRRNHPHKIKTNVKITSLDKSLQKTVLAEVPEEGHELKNTSPNMKPKNTSISLPYFVPSSPSLAPQIDPRLAALATSRGYISTAPSLITRLEPGISPHHQHLNAGRISFTSRSSRPSFFLCFFDSDAFPQPRWSYLEDPRDPYIPAPGSKGACPPPSSPSFVGYFSGQAPLGTSSTLACRLSPFLGVGGWDWDWARCGR